jgi:hypothetical protein
VHDTGRLFDLLDAGGRQLVLPAGFERFTPDDVQLNELGVQSVEDVAGNALCIELAEVVLPLVLRFAVGGQGQLLLGADGTRRWLLLLLAQF